MRPYIAIALLASIAFFIYNVKKISDLRTEYHELEAEVAQKTSNSAIAGGMVKSFFDGFTFGAFADEGMFTEYKKADRWIEDVTRREARINSQYAETVKHRNWSLIAIFTCTLGVIFIKSEKTEKKPE